MLKNKYIAKLLVLPIIASALLSISSCKEKDDKLPGEPENAEPFNELEELADLAGTEVDGKEVSKECAVTCYKIQQASDELDFVKSPSNLTRAKREFQKNSSDAVDDINSLNGEEKQIAMKKLEELTAQYEKMCREYEVPASGVIANLKNLIEEIDKVHNMQDFENFKSCRVGVLNNLDDIHLCVEQKSSKINDVKRLAQILKGKYEAKKREFGIE